jgi:hypothetical protein
LLKKIRYAPCLGGLFRLGRLLLGGVGAVLGRGGSLLGSVALRLDLGLGGRAAPVSSLEGSCGDLGEGRMEEAAQLVLLVDNHAGDGREHVGKARLWALIDPRQ